MYKNHGHRLHTWNTNPPTSKLQSSRPHGLHRLKHRKSTKVASGTVVAFQRRQKLCEKKREELGKKNLGFTMIYHGLSWFTMIYPHVKKITQSPPTNFAFPFR